MVGGKIKKNANTIRTPVRSSKVAQTTGLIMHNNDNAATEEFIALYTAAQQDIYRYILMLMPNATDAKDVLQEAALALWRKFPEFDRSKPFTPWACRFAYFHTLKHCERKKKSPSYLDPDVLEAIANKTPYVSTRHIDRGTALQQCLAKLTDSERELVGFRYQKDITIQQVAKTTGKNIHTLYKRLERIRKDLYNCVNRTVLEL
jgi:RNA polymerase sigma-70 factor (ECF subfamily)